jgi:hypothetical protein
LTTRGHLTKFRQASFVGKTEDVYLLFWPGRGHTRATDR